MAEIRQQVRTYVVDNFLLGRGAAPPDEASLLQRGVLDSTSVLELVAFLETQYQIAVSDEEIVPQNLDSISAVAAFVARKRGPA